MVSIVSTAKSPADIPKTIIFAPTKTSVCKIYSMLAKHSVDNKYIRMFHASLTPSTKAVCVVDFKSGRIRCLVSTIAFGMVRFQNVYP